MLGLTLYHHHGLARRALEQGQEQRADFAKKIKV